MKGAYQGTRSLRTGGAAAAYNDGLLARGSANVELAVTGREDVVGEVDRVFGRGGEGPEIAVACCTREDYGRGEGCEAEQGGEDGGGDGRHCGLNSVLGGFLWEKGMLGWMDKLNG